MQSYITIKNHSEFEYEDRKSIFIAEAMPVETEDEALSFIEHMKRKYPDATHHVYAYVLKDNSISRFSDDREPQGTAGMPVLDSIRKNGIVNAAVVVIRYFGGTLLGTGGLVRAYSAAAVGAVKGAGIVTYDVYASYELECSYSDYQRLGLIFRDSGFRQNDIDYSDVIKIVGSIRASEAESFENALVQATGARIVITKTGEKFDF